MISIIAAVAQNGVIGDKNALLWHISEDLRFFKRTTSGHPVIMGRKTYESLGRPLPNRTNVVISRTPREIEGCTVVSSLEEAIALFPKEEEIFIIGGAQIYALALGVANKMYLTKVYHDYQGDTSFPEWNANEWQLTQKESFECGEKYPHPFSFETYIRK
ncbi:MAG: dihydrofolate reductase [Alistipes sp.]|nr:dihydrofolate reductase [Alistipes sp.]